MPLSQSLPQSPRGLRRTPVFRYRVNAKDAFVFVNQAFMDFARQNDAPEFSTRDLYSRSIWDYIRDPSIAEVYRVLMERARRELNVIQFPFRCDAPDLIRFMEMRIMPLGLDMLEFQTQILRQEPRPFRTLISRGAYRSAEILPICSWCKRVRVEDEIWLELDEALLRTAMLDVEPLPTLDHITCTACKSKILIPLDASQLLGA